jgi:hypothetical protein
MRRFLALLLLQGLRRYSKKQPSHVSLYLAFQLALQLDPKTLRLEAQ